MSKPLISLKNISFQYNQKKALDDINVDIYQGDFVGIVGPNGSGKTTLLKIILGLLKPNEGEVLISGKKVSAGKHQQVAYIPQKVTQNESRFPITVNEVVGLGLIDKNNLFKFYKPSNFDKKNAVETALNKVKMLEHKDKLLTDLSGGQQQRVFIAKSLVKDAKILILDEPTVGVDPDSQEKFYHLLKNLNQKDGLTIMIVSHDTDVIIQEVNTVLCLNKKLVCHTDPETFMKNDYFEKIYGHSHKLLKHEH
jgi:zinc transport system ATP-binding protein